MLSPTDELLDDLSQLVSTFLDESILTFVEDKGVVSLPPSD